MNALASKRPDVAKKIMGYQKGGMSKNKKMMGGGMMKKKRTGSKMERQPGGSFGKPKAPSKGGMGYAEGGPVTVRSGDTLSQIAKSKGITLASLMAANPGIKNANQIRVGQKIKMPTGGAKSRAQGIAKKKGVYGDTSKPVMSALARDTAARKAAKAGKKAYKAKTVNNPKNARKIATTPTKISNLGKINQERRADDAASKKSSFAGKKPIKNPRSGNPMLTPKRAAAMTGSTKSVTSSENKRLDAIRKKARSRSDRRMGGGSMKKVQGYKSGGTVRGAGASTRGKGFTRAG